MVTLVSLYLYVGLLFYVIVILVWRNEEIGFHGNVFLAKLLYYENCSKTFCLECLL